MLYYRKNSTCGFQISNNQPSRTSVCLWMTFNYSYFDCNKRQIMFHVIPSSGLSCACCYAIFRFRFISFWTQIVGIIRQSLVYNLYVKNSSLRGCNKKTGADALPYISSFGANVNIQFIHVHRKIIIGCDDSVS